MCSVSPRYNIAGGSNVGRQGMGGLLVQFLGLFALLGLAAWGYRHWISTRQIGIQGKGMLLLSVVTLVGGLLGSTGW